MSSDKKFFNLLIKAQQIQFEPKISIKGNVTSRMSFLGYPEQMIFMPIKPCTSEILILNTGRSFTFNISHGVMLELHKNFTIDLDLYQINPEKRLSVVKLDLTKIYRQLFDDPCFKVSKTQMNAVVEFNDKGGKRIACMDVIVQLSPTGPTIQNQFNMGSLVDKQYLSVPNKCYECPSVPDLQFQKKQHNDDGEWDLMYAELENGQKIAIKYERNYYEFKSSEVNEPCKPTNGGVKLGKKDEKLNIAMIEIMDEMHKLIIANNVSH